MTHILGGRDMVIIPMLVILTFIQLKKVGDLNGDFIRVYNVSLIWGLCTSK
jgi:hypothetical protein